MPRCTVNLDLLRRGDYKLYIDVAKVAGTDEGVVKVEVNDEIFSRIVEWAKRPIGEPAPQPAPPTPPAPLPPQIDLDAELKKDLDASAARQRLNEYVQKGLTDSEDNFVLIKAHVDAAGGYWSLENVDSAIAALGSKLNWRPKVLVLNPKLERLGTLPNGEPQLPIDAKEYAMKQASVAQLKDLNRRRREATGQMVVGPNRRNPSSFGSNF